MIGERIRRIVRGMANNAPTFVPPFAERVFWLTIVLIGIMNLGHIAIEHVKAAQVAESTQNIPVGGCVVTIAGQPSCWNGKEWVPVPSVSHDAKSWAVMELGRNDSFTTTRIEVVEFEGVCLYLSRAGSAIATSAVPKTALRPGVGCQ